jgi:hypothetical protein
MPTPEQMLACIQVCQALSNFYLDIHLFRFDAKRGELYILAGQSLGITSTTVFGNLTMTQQPDFQTMSRKELRSYVLSHRDNEDALRIYMDRLKNEPGIDRHQGGITADDLARLDRLLQQSVIKTGEAN